MLCPFLYLKVNLVSLGDWFPENTTVKTAFPISEVCTLQEAEAGGCEKEGSRSGEAWGEWRAQCPLMPPRARGLCPAVMQTLATRSAPVPKKREEAGLYVESPVLKCYLGL